MVQPGRGPESTYSPLVGKYSSKLQGELYPQARSTRSLIFTPADNDDDNDIL